MHVSLSHLSVDALTARLVDALDREDHAVLDFVFVLAELKRRGAHLALGFDSLFTYCADGLKLERSRAYRRSAAADLVDRYPLVGQMLRSRRLTLSALLPLNTLLTPQNHKELLRRAAGLTEEQAKRLASELRPLPPSDDSIRLVHTLRPPPPGEVPTPRFSFSLKQGAASPDAPSLAAPSSPLSPTIERPPELVLTETYRLNATLSKEVHGRLLDLKAALAHKIPNGDLNEILGEAFTLAIDALVRRKIGAGPAREPHPTALTPDDRRLTDSADSADSATRELPQRAPDAVAPLGSSCPPLRSPPERESAGDELTPVSERARADAAFDYRQPVLATLDQADHHDAEGDNTEDIVSVFEEVDDAGERQLNDTNVDDPDIESNSRYVPADVRRAVWERDEGSCSFVGKTGRRCGSKYRLEFDHWKAFARGGKSTVANVRLRCRRHNLHEAELTYGRAFMLRFVARRMDPGEVAASAPRHADDGERGRRESDLRLLAIFEPREGVDA